MNPNLAHLRPYPFERLRELLAGVNPPADRRPISLSIGEPKHPTPGFIRDALTAALPSLSNYPITRGERPLREAIARWIGRRHGIEAPDPERQVLPVLGSREALFAFAQVIIDGTRSGASAVLPNPFYQIYEGGTVLAGATPRFVSSLPENHWAPRWESLGAAAWPTVQLVFVCSPDNPTGRVMERAEWKALFELSDRYGFVIASDECYSEIYDDEASPPLGALAAATALGRGDFRRLVVFSSLSKRSNVPGLRSGFVAGDERLIAAFLLYRTYHGSAMSGPVSGASLAAWGDEAHVRENRAAYRRKFDLVTPRLARLLEVERPAASFYLWAKVPGSDLEFTRRLYAEENVLVLPGSLLSRPVDGRNPGEGYVRLALVADVGECDEAAKRIEAFMQRARSQEGS